MSASLTEFEPSLATLLLDEEGSLTLEFESILLSVFLKYASNSPSTFSSTPSSSTTTTTTTTIDIFSNSKTLSRKDLDQFSLVTNGCLMTDETFGEISEYLDMLEPEDLDDENDGDDDDDESTDKKLEKEEKIEERLTFKGFLQLYQLQTESDEEETWRDLSKWGYSRELKEFTLILDQSDSTNEDVKVVEKEKEKEKDEKVDAKVEELLELLSVKDTKEQGKK